MTNIKKIIASITAYVLKKEDISVNQSLAIEKTALINPINPVSPYFKRYGYPSDVDTTEQRLVKANVPLNPEQYQKMFKEMINLKSFMNGDKSLVLKKIYEDLKRVNNILLPLKKMGISLTLDLTGGAVRDFVLNNHKNITDLDIMVSFCESKVDNLQLKNFEKLGFTKNELDKVREGSTSAIQTKLVELCFKKYDMVEKTYIHNNRQEKLDTKNDYSMITDRLAGVIKLKNKFTNYHIDLLVTDFVKPAFLKDFDINLCKASICMINKAYKKDFPKDYTHLVSRFSADIDFFADIHNKKLTIDIGNRTSAMLNSILQKHLPKVVKKYPDYMINFIDTNAVDCVRLDEVKSKFIMDKLETNLKHKEKSKKNIKI